MRVEFGGMRPGNPLGESHQYEFQITKSAENPLIGGRTIVLGLYGGKCNTNRLP